MQRGAKIVPYQNHRQQVLEIHSPLLQVSALHTIFLVKELVKAGLTFFLHAVFDLYLFKEMVMCNSDFGI